MDFSFSEEQQGLAQVVRDLLAAKCTAEHVRAATEAGGDVPGLHDALAQMGVVAILQAEESGGLGLGVVEACLALHELGFAGAPGRWLEVLLTDHATANSDQDRALRYTTGAAAMLCGLARRMLDLALQHVKAREQFGRPVGSFQAVQHHLADARLKIEFAAPMVWRAAFELDAASPQAAVAAWSAKSLATEAALLTATKSLQCHGAMGYAHEHDLQLFMKQVWALAPQHGDAAACRRHIATALDL
jgi:alkylation response protein AidB-like acyl-CoA dehydrogenase